MNHCSPKMNEQFVQFLAAIRHQTCVCFYSICSVFVFQGRLNELMSQIRMQNHFGAVRSEERYSVDADLLREIRQVSWNFSTSDLQLLCRHSQHVFSDC